MGSLFEYIDRHYNHCDNSYPLAHNLVSSHYISEAVRFPVDVRLYRRYEGGDRLGNLCEEALSKAGDSAQQESPSQTSQGG